MLQTSFFVLSYQRISHASYVCFLVFIFTFFGLFLICINWWFSYKWRETSCLNFTDKKKALTHDKIVVILWYVFFRDNTWTIPHPRSQKEVDLHIFLTTISLPLPVGMEDDYEWRATDLACSSFRSNTTWEALRPREDRKEWSDVVWIRGGIPKHSFTMWIANYDRLPTRSRLASWGLQISPLCPFCSTHDENRDHLLLACVYSTDIWREVMIRCCSPSTRLTTWSELLSWIRASASRKLLLLRKLATQTTVFHLWKQRNNLIHNQSSISVASVFFGIDRDMKNIISARRVRKRFRSLMVLWLR